ncbi:MAG TPA: cyclic nucleotide-binding domain-containing protein [Thermoanaerobaculia bacterium]|jgi:CRP-like cAMP-binding protein|nr:cyclic nucleotide-binding domain-containing protein [Thermoanaerobaculia bacterium]
MLAEILARSETFADLKPEQLRSLAAHCAEVPVPAGRLVFAHGELGDAVYLVLEGQITVFRDQVGRPMQLLARLGAGELLGELCLFDEVTRSASARAATDVRLLRLAREPLMELLRQEPHLALHIQNAAARRRSSNSAAALELGQQSEVRIRLRAPVRMHFADGTVVPAELANLSVGGLSLSGAPTDWAPGTAVHFELHSEGDVLPVDGRVAWQHEDAVGIAFASQATGHERVVYRLLRKLGS